MELRQFRYFLAIVDCGSLSRAAEKLHVAQSALSKQLAVLEEELAVQLLQRSRTGVVVTEAGKVFYEYAQGITKQVRDARAAVHRSSGAVVGSIVVALPQSASATLALPLMRAVTARYPGIVFHLNEELTGNMADQLVRGRVDLAVFTDTMPAQDIVFTPLVEEPFFYIHAAADAAAPPPGDVSIAQALARALVLPAPQHSHCTRAIVDDALRAAGHPVQRVAVEINSVYVLKSAVEAGLGPTIMPLGLAQRDVDDGRMAAHRIAGGALVRVLGRCASRHLPQSNVKRAIADLIDDVVRGLCDGGAWTGARYLGKPADQCVHQQVDRPMLARAAG